MFISLRRLIMNILKTLVLVLGLTLSVSSFAHGYGGYHGGYGGHYRGGYYNHYGFYGPSLLIGGVVGYELAQPRVIYTQPTVVYQDPVVYSQPTTTQVIESVPSGYHSEVILDGKCNCYRTVLVRN